MSILLRSSAAGNCATSGCAAPHKFPLSQRSLLRGLFLLGFLFASAQALHPIYDMRYTIGPEIFIPEEGEAGGGFHTRYESDFTVPGFFKFGLDERWEIGTRLEIQTDDNLAHRLLFLDAGTKFRLNSYSALQADLFVGINNSYGGALLLGYTTARRYNRLISALYETRIGFFDAVTGPDGIATIQVGAYPQTDAGKLFRFRLGLVGSNTLGHFADAFRMDLMPSVLFRPMPMVQVHADWAIGIIGNTGHRLGIYATTKI